MKRHPIIDHAIAELAYAREAAENAGRDLAKALADALTEDDREKTNFAMRMCDTLDGMARMIETTIIRINYKSPV
jgi:hypothetical protein